MDNLLESKKLAWFLIISGAVLRLLLYWANHPANAYDDHFKPIGIMISSGWIAPLDACWQCHHPPFFYAIGAFVGKAALTLGLTEGAVLKVLQFLPCLYGLLTLPVVYAALGRLRLSPLARVSGLTLVSFLPRHIYMSAMHTNDTLAALVVSLSVLLLIKATDEGFPPRTTVLLAITMTAAVLTKITALITIPMAGAALILMLIPSIDGVSGTDRKGLKLRFLAAFTMPIAVLAALIMINYSNYGTFFPVNLEVLDFKMKMTFLPGKEFISFFHFNPLLVIKTPVLTDESVNSFWTVIYGKFFFDIEPKFLFLSELKSAWASTYYSYFTGESAVFAGVGGFSRVHLLFGRVLTTLGLPLLILSIAGFFRAITTRVTWSLPLGAVLLANLAGVLFITISLPIYSSMKAAYLLNSLVPFAFFFAMGAAWLEDKSIGRQLVALYLTLFSVIVTLHILTLFFTSSYRGAFSI